MIKVRLFGILRLESGIKEAALDVHSVRELYTELGRLSEALTVKKLKGCHIIVNGEPLGKKAAFKDGDELMLLSPVAGG